MVEVASIEAIRAVQATQSLQYIQEQQQAAKVADPKAVEAFQAAMGVGGPDPVPFASEVSAAWRSSQELANVRMHKIEALINSNAVAGVSMAQMTQLQYDLVNLGFQLGIVSDVAKKASSAVETLVKNG